MKPAAFLDTGVFIAFMNRRDQWHDQVTPLFEVPPPHWCTSLLVVSESYSWFLHRHGEEAARQFRQLLCHLPGLALLESSTRQHQKTLAILDRFRGTQLTYVDASSLAFLQTEKIADVWTTDQHLGLTGARVLPGRIQ
jgi:predicted nucleic acid-binding protein